MMLLAAGRRTGKSSQAFAWVSHGVKVKGYPGWSRVLVVHSDAALALHRHDYWSRLEDFDHRVYSYQDWYSARGVRSDTGVCLDEMNLMPSWLLPGRVVAGTLTADPWMHQVFNNGWSQDADRLDALDFDGVGYLP